MFMLQARKFMSIILCLLVISALFLPTINIPVVSTVGAEEEGSRTETRADKPVGNGPYSTAWVFDYIPREGTTDVPARIYYPSSGGGVVNPSNAPYKGVVFAPGAGGTETAYVSLLSTIASWGYIVTIVGTGGPCNQEVVDIQSYVVNYYEQMNANSSSRFYNKIDATACGASGHSNGGWAAIAGAVADERFKAVSPLAAVGMAPRPSRRAGAEEAGLLAI